MTRRERPRRTGIGDVLLSRLPGNSPVHRMWVGTKLIVVTALTIAVLLQPNWQQIAGVAGVAVSAVVAAKVPFSATPRLPVWFWAPLLLGLVIAAAGNGIGYYLSLVALSMLFLVLSLILAWTTALDDLAPALSSIGRPLRRIGLPVDEWAVVVGLAVRSLPMLVEEFRTLLAVRRLRRQPGSTTRPSALGMAAGDLLSAALASTIRRASDMGTAITARGGATVRSTSRVRVGWPDAVAVVMTAAACVLPTVLAT